MFLHSVESVARKEIPMKLSRLIGATTAALIIFTLLAMPHLTSAQGITSLLASANGKGKLQVEKNLASPSGCEIEARWLGRNHVVIDLQLFVTGTWSNAADSAEGIDLRFSSTFSPSESSLVAQGRMTGQFGKLPRRGK